MNIKWIEEKEKGILNETLLNYVLILISLFFVAFNLIENTPTTDAFDN